MDLPVALSAASMFGVVRSGGDRASALTSLRVPLNVTAVGSRAMWASAVSFSILDSS